MTQFVARLTILALALALSAGAVAQEGSDGDAASDGAGSLAAALRDDPRLSTFAELLDGTGLLFQLEDPARLTLFAPSDRAFERLGEENVRTLLRDRGALDAIVRHHMVWGATPADALRRMDALTTVEGTRLSLSNVGDGVQVDGALVLDGIRAGDGMLYVVDSLLLPEGSVMVKDLLSAPQSGR